MLKLTASGTSEAPDPKGRQESSWDGGQLRGTTRPGPRSVSHDLGIPPIHTHSPTHSAHTDLRRQPTESPQTRRNTCIGRCGAHPPFACSPSFSAARRGSPETHCQAGKSPGSAHRRRGARVSNEPQRLESHTPTQNHQWPTLPTKFRPSGRPLRPSPRSRCRGSEPTAREGDGQN